jgi:hypothetical protein
VVFFFFNEMRLKKKPLFRGGVQCLARQLFFFLLKTFHSFPIFYIFQFLQIFFFSQFINSQLTMISKPIPATFRNLPSYKILGRAQSLILFKENHVNTYTKFAVNAEEYNQVDRICPGPLIVKCRLKI